MQIKEFRRDEFIDRENEIGFFRLFQSSSK